MSKELKQLIKHLEGFIDAYSYPRGKDAMDAKYAAETLLGFLTKGENK